MLSSISPEVWTTAGIVTAVLMGGMVRRVWRPMRKTVAAIDVVAGRPERYPGDEEARPGLAERLDNIDKAIGKTNANVSAMRSELDNVKQHVQNLEGECPS
jgi:hypothetical protein